jgi:hypothetical protein
VFGKHRSAGTKFGLLAASSEAQVLAERRRALVGLHSRGKSAARGKSLRASLLTSPLCWSNRARAPQPKVPAVDISREPAHAKAEPQVAPLATPRPALPHHAQRPMYAQVATWNSYHPWATPGVSRTHGPHLGNE